MNISTILAERSESKCELCSATDDLSSYTVPPKNTENPEDQIVLCFTCLPQVKEEQSLDVNHLRCLNESMWSQVPAVQVISYRLLEKLSRESWAQDAINMMYLDESILEWAQTGAAAKVVHKDINGNILKNGDTVTLTQDLNVKGSSLTAKRGVAVRRIRLDPDNEKYIEGKVDGQHIVILTKYCKQQ